MTGATLQLKADDANVDWSSVKLNGDAVADLISAEDATVLVWTSTGESMTFKGLPAGTYEVSEVSAKAGYLATTQKWAVTVSANGAISVNNQVSTDGQDRSIITITNEASTIQINKKALDGGNIAAEEAEFKLTAKDEHATLNSVQIGATKITEDTTSATFKEMLPFLLCRMARMNWKKSQLERIHNDFHLYLCCKEWRCNNRIGSNKRRS